VSINWQWAAANYATFTTAYNALGAKPVDDKQASQYQKLRSRRYAGNFKLSVIGGATDGGGSNYTGGYSGAGSVRCPR